MSVCTSATVAASSAVIAPIHATTVHRVAARASKNGWARHEQEHAGGHHRRGVDQRRDRGGALHRVGQPDVQRELRALAHRADEEQQRDRGDRRLRRACRPPASVARVVERCRRFAKIRNIASMKPKSPTRLVTNAFLPATAAELRSNQNEIEQVRAEADALPAEEGDEEARRRARARASTRRTGSGRRRTARSAGRRACTRSSTGGSASRRR